MDNLKVIKSVIYNTSFKDYMYDGMSFSEPIMTIIDGNIIDNYFIYSFNGNEYYKPIIIFGINSTTGEEVYSRKADELKNEKYVSEFDPSLNMADYRKYEKLFSEVRKMIYKNLNNEERNLVKEYLISLKKVSGSALWMFYKVLFVDFFEWIKNENIEI